MTWPPFGVVFEGVAIFGIAYGLFLALWRGRASRDRVVGALLAVTCALVVFLGLPRTGRRRPSPAVLCLVNVKELCQSQLIYINDNDDRLPAAGHLAASFRENPWTASQSCPSAPGRPGYATNAAVLGHSLHKIADPALKVMLFEADAPTAYYAGTVANLPAQPRHDDADSFGYVDGHARSVKRTRPRPQF